MLTSSICGKSRWKNLRVGCWCSTDSPPHCRSTPLPPSRLWPRNSNAMVHINRLWSLKLTDNRLFRSRTTPLQSPTLAQLESIFAFEPSRLRRRLSNSRFGTRPDKSAFEQLRQLIIVEQVSVMDSLRRLHSQEYPYPTSHGTF